MTLPGGVMLALDESWTRAQNDAFFNHNSIEPSRVSELDYLTNGFFIDTEPGFPSLQLANSLASQEGVEAASPNWQCETQPMIKSKDEPATGPAPHAKYQPATKRMMPPRPERPAGRKTDLRSDREPDGGSDYNSSYTATTLRTRGAVGPFPASRQRMPPKTR